jgi:hypothetical protein
VEFFITAGALLIGSAAYLIHQFAQTLRAGPPTRDAAADDVTEFPAPASDLKAA